MTTCNPVFSTRLQPLFFYLNLIRILIINSSCQKCNSVDKFGDERKFTNNLLKFYVPCHINDDNLFWSGCILHLFLSATCFSRHLSNFRSHPSLRHAVTSSFNLFSNHEIFPNRQMNTNRQNANLLKYFLSPAFSTSACAAYSISHYNKQPQPRISPFFKSTSATRRIYDIPGTYVGTYRKNIQRTHAIILRRRCYSASLPPPPPPTNPCRSTTHNTLQRHATRRVDDLKILTTSELWLERLAIRQAYRGKEWPSGRANAGKLIAGNSLGIAAGSHS